MGLSKNYWFKSGTYTMMQRVVAFLFGFGSYFFLVRYYDIDSFGVWTLYVVISSTVEISRSSFVQNAFLKFFNEEGADRTVLFYASLFLNAMSTLAIVVILLVLIPVLKVFWDSHTIGSLILCYCVTSLILIPFTQFNYLEQANHSFKGIFWSSTFRQGAFFILVIVCFLFFRDLPLVFFAAAQTVCAFLGLLVAYIMNKKLLPSTYAFDWAVVKKLYRFGRYILGTGITSNIGKSADQMILGAVSHNMVAIYNSCIRVLNFIEIPTLSVSSIVYPKIAARASEGNAAVGKLYEKSVASILCMILPAAIFIVLFPTFVLTVIAGEKYIIAASTLQVIALGSLFLPFNIQVGCACEVTNKPQVSFYINLIANIINILLNIILIRSFGVIGSALSFLITVAFIFSLGQYYVSKNLEVRLFQIFVQVINNYGQMYQWLMMRLKIRTR